MSKQIILTRTDKSVSIEMYHMIRIISNPNLSFPCDIRNMFSEFHSIRECSNIYFADFRLLQKIL